MTLKKRELIKDEPVVDAPPPYSDEFTAEGGKREPLTPPRNLSPAPRDPSTEIAQPSASSSVTRPKPPSDAQRARAPLHVSQTNSKIQSNYLVTKSATTSPPDATLETTNGKIECGIWADDSTWKRPFALFAKTSNAKINLSVSTVAAKQAVDITATTSNGSVNVLLPTDFQGVLIMSTTNSKATLSASLQAKSVRIPNGPDEDSKTAATYEIDGGGESRAEIRTSNAKIQAGYVGDVQAAEESSSCTVM